MPEPVYTASYLAEIIADSGCDLTDDAAITEALVARGIRPSQCGDVWHEMRWIASDIRRDRARGLTLPQVVAAVWTAAIGLAALAVATIIETGAV